MKRKLLTAGLCAALLICCLSTTAFAYADDPGTDTGGVDLWEGLDPAEALPVEASEPETETESNPFTPSGTGTVTDNATDEDGKEFFTITTADESVFYLVIDRQNSTENVYFLNAVTVADLAALAEANGETVAVPDNTTPTETETREAADPAQDSEPEQPAATKSNTGTLLLVAAVALIGGVVAYIFKVRRPKQARAEAEEDAAEADYDDNPPWDEDEDAGEPKE